jgi:hypothetical protein
MSYEPKLGTVLVLGTPEYQAAIDRTHAMAARDAAAETEAAA